VLNAALAEILEPDRSRLAFTPVEAAGVLRTFTFCLGWVKTPCSRAGRSGTDQQSGHRVQRPRGLGVAGHNSVAFTLTRYGGLFEDGSNQAVDRLDALLQGGQKPGPVLELRRN